MSSDGPLVVGGKPIGSIPPYVVIMFEMTILFGALSTILGILFNALFGARRLGTVAYDPRFTNDKFGIFVPCEPARAGQVEALLRGAGAEEVRRAWGRAPPGGHRDPYVRVPGRRVATR